MTLFPDPPAPAAPPPEPAAALPPLPEPERAEALAWLRYRLRKVCRFWGEAIGRSEGFVTPEAAVRMIGEHHRLKRFDRGWAAELFRGGKYWGE